MKIEYVNSFIDHKRIGFGFDFNYNRDLHLALQHFKNEKLLIFQLIFFEIWLWI